MLSIFVICVLFPSALCTVGVQFITGPENCIDNEYFNTAARQCVDCGDNLTHVDHETCACSPGFKKVTDVGAAAYSTTADNRPLAQKCEECPADQEVSPDGWDCIPCQDGAAPVQETRQCSECDNQQHSLIVRNALGALFGTISCQQCSPKFGPSDDGSGCERCNADFQFVDDNTTAGCACPVGSTQVQSPSGSVCFPGDQSIPNPQGTVYQIVYAANAQQESQYLVNNFPAEYFKCTIYRDIKACQVIANMCVMTVYRLNTNGPSICSVYNLAAEDEVVTEGLPKTMPSLIITDDKVLATENFPDDYTMDTGKNSDWLRLVGYKYDVDGNYMGFVEAWNTGAFQLCKGDQFSLQLAYRFGKDLDKTCSLRVRELVDDYETVFYDVYMKFTTTDDATDKLFDFPMTFQTSAGSARYYRRMFLVDNVSGRDNPEDDDILGSYLSKLELFYTTEFAETKPISLKLTYSPLRRSDYNNDATVDTQFIVNYDQRYKEFNRSIGMAVGVLGIMVSVYSVVKVNGWRKRAGATTIDLFAMIKFTFSWFGVIANVFFLILYFTGLYLLLSWRNQEVLYILLPSPTDRGDIRPFIGYFLTGILAKVIEILHLIYSQCSVDIFFIDWERPKTAPGKKEEKKSAAEGSSVSIWRTYFVANEWNEIQTIRKTNVMFQIVATIFFLEGLNFKEFARADPSNDLFPDENYVNSPYNTWLRFAVGASVYIAIGIAQYLFEILFYSRFIEDPFNQFIDLCSISNISAFIMSQKQYGYYIHGRSVHGFADANLAQLSLLMQKEQDDLRGTRGLLPDSAIQTFEIIVPLNLRTAYRKLFKPPVPSNAAKAATAADQSGVDRSSLSQLDPQLRKSIEGYTQLNAFLAAFINRDIPDCDYEVRERPFVEKLLDMEFVEVSATRGIFYSDSGHVFDKVLFYGNEFSLFLFDVYLFVAIDYMIESYLLSAIGVYIVQKILVPIREILGQRNLAKKTLVDERFLI
ncbi:meckelin-like isoform X2 [Convolutriloba macropyga]|uniref:meckelin-like isoform X2 n=1 Tax=Convolutriloba macropyga TaxID=536237 RepID=UPI003F523A9B